MQKGEILLPKTTTHQNYDKKWCEKQHAGTFNNPTTSHNLEEMKIIPVI